MITIQYTPVKSQIIGQLSEEHVKDLDSLLSFKMTGAEYSDQYLAGAWDGYKHYFSVKTKQFRSGMLYLVLKYLDECSIPYQLNGHPVVERNQQRGPYTLRPHQELCVDAMFVRLRGIVQSPPRSGKTMIASAFLDQSRQFPAIFLCNSLDIASQTFQTFQKNIPDVELGYLGDGKCSLKAITIATVQSVIAAYEVAYKTKHAKKRKAKGREYKKIGTENELTEEQRLYVRNFFESCKTIIYDECHHSQSPIAVFLYDKIKKAKIVLGLSATPNYGRPEDMVIEATIGPVIAKITYHELIQQGYLLPPKIFLYKVPKVRTSTNSWKTVYKEAVSDNPFRNTLIAHIAAKLNRMDKTVLVVVDEISHGNRIAELYPDARVLYGSAGVDERNDVKDKLDRGIIKCVISTLWDEGADIPGLNYVINAAGGANPVSTFQRLRSITPNPRDSKKTFGGVIDFYHREKHLMSHCNFRKRQYSGEMDFQILERDVQRWTVDDIEREFA